MKRKNVLALAALLISSTLLVSCTNQNQKVQFSEYWHKDMNTPSATVLEQLTYKVETDTSNAASANSYSVDYNGTYTTKLEKDAENNYVYTTELSVTAVYDYGTGKSTELTDNVKSTVVFQNAANALKPVRTEKEIVSHSPVNGDIDANTDFNALKSHCKVVVDYSKNESSVYNLLRAENENGYKTTEKIEIKDKDAKKYSYLDNEQLLFALRGINPTTTASPTLLVYAPFSGAVQQIKATIGTLAIAEDFAFQSVDRGAEEKADISYYPITLSINAKNSGAAHTVWIAKTTDSNSNQYRNVMLKYEAPIAYNLGKLVYTLTQADFID